MARPGLVFPSADGLWVGDAHRHLFQRAAVAPPSIWLLGARLTALPIR